MSLAIRQARTGEEGLVLDFVRKLAAYERLEGEVEASAEDFRDALFGPRPRVFCDIAEWDGRPAGLALWFYSFSTFRGRHGIYLEDLFVDPEARGRGIGKALLAQIARRCVDQRLGRLEWSVLDWNAPSIAFYEARGARMMDGWTACRIDGEALARLAEASS